MYLFRHWTKLFNVVKKNGILKKVDQSHVLKAKIVQPLPDQN